MFLAWAVRPSAASGRLRRASDDEITLFKSVGLAVQDLAIAQRAAIAAGIMEAS